MSPGILCDVTSVKATPTAFGAFIQCLCGSPTDMLTRTGCLGDRMDSIGTPERGIRKMTFILWVLHQEINGSWESTVSNGQGIEGCLKEEGFSWSCQEWGSRGGSFWEAMVLFYFSELLKSRHRVEDFWWLVWQRAWDGQSFSCCAEGIVLSLCVGRKYRGTEEASVPALHFTHTGFLLVVCH